MIDKDIVTTVTIKQRITLDNLDVIRQVASELGIPSDARFTYGSESAYADTSTISYRWSVRKPVEPSKLPKINKTAYETIYGRKDPKAF